MLKALYQLTLEVEPAGSYASVMESRTVEAETVAQALAAVCDWPATADNLELGGMAVDPTTGPLLKRCWFATRLRYLL